MLLYILPGDKWFGGEGCDYPVIVDRLRLSVCKETCTVSTRSSFLETLSWNLLLYGGSKYVDNDHFMMHSG